MKIQVLPSDSSGASGVENSYAATLLINDVVALDAGCLGFFGDADRQRKVRHVFVSHAHLDHTASLPMFLENTFSAGEECATVHALEEVHAWLQEHMFNDRMWPDFVRLTTPGTQLIKCAPLTSGETVEVAGLSVTPISVHHGVPTVGFIVDDGVSAIAYSADTADTSELFEVATANPRLKAVFLECSFPKALTWLAKESFHLTPEMFATIVKRQLADVPVYPVLMKARYRQDTMAEMEQLGLPNLRVTRGGEAIEIR